MTSRLKTRFSQKNLKKYLKKNKNLNQSKKIPKNTAKLKKTHKITSKKLGVDLLLNRARKPYENEISNETSEKLKKKKIKRRSTKRHFPGF